MAGHRFGLIGAAGFVAPRHMRAILETGNEVVCAMDPKDSVGIIDSFFPNAHFFTEFERFDRHAELLRRRDQGLRYVSICSPNYLHDAHIRFAVRHGADAICEKPLVLNPWNLDALQELGDETGRRIFTILQLRLHPTIIKLREEVLDASTDHVFDVDLAYVTSRGRWYRTSWKGADEKSGGIATNIGVHFFDMLSWVFGSVIENRVHVLTEAFGAGFLHLERARVRWFLSIDRKHLPPATLADGKQTYRAITVDGKAVEFSDGFTDLHTTSYEHILSRGGFRVADARPSIQIVHAIRTAALEGLDGFEHPYARTALDGAAAS